MYDCGGCTACCKIMKVHELEKQANVWCQHCKIGVGCTSYESRPDSCRVYECVWLQSQREPRPLPLALRPDKSRVVIGTTNHGEDVVLYVSQDRPDAWRRDNVASFVAELQARGIVVLLSRGDILQKL